MNNPAPFLFSAIFIGLGATLTMDLWALFLKQVFKTTASNYCLIGRWLLTMLDGTFKHSNIASAPQKRSECAVGWIAHYMIGVTYAVTFLALVGNHWRLQPTVVPAILFGVVTVLAPFFIMQPAFGYGFAASKTPNPKQARLRSLMNHTLFGIGLYLFGLLANWLL